MFNCTCSFSSDNIFSISISDQGKYPYFINLDPAFVKFFIFVCVCVLARVLMCVLIGFNLSDTLGTEQKCVILQ